MLSKTPPQEAKRRLMRRHSNIMNQRKSVLPLKKLKIVRNLNKMESLKLSSRKVKLKIAR